MPLFKTARWSTFEEVEILLQIAEPYDHVIECGTANGWSAAWFAQAGKTVTTFDRFRRPYIWDHFNGLKHLTNKITCVTGQFYEAVLPYRRKEPTMYFIDGDHRFTPTRRDFMAVKDSPGIFVFHDSGKEPGVIDFLKTLRNKGFDQEYYECERGITVVRKHG